VGAGYEIFILRIRRAALGTGRQGLWARGPDEIRGHKPQVPRGFGHAFQRWDLVIPRGDGVRSCIPALDLAESV
jgi:hypothetical protein